jgi:hypothetical protein
MARRWAAPQRFRPHRHPVGHEGLCALGMQGRIVAIGQQGERRDRGLPGHHSFRQLLLQRSGPGPIAYREHDFGHADGGIDVLRIDR